MGLLEKYNSQYEPVKKAPQVLDVGDENPGFVIQFTVKVSGGDLKLKHIKLILAGVSLLLVAGSIFFFRSAFVPASSPPSGFEGNIPKTPEYFPPPAPAEVQIKYGEPK